MNRHASAGQTGKGEIKAEPPGDDAVFPRKGDGGGRMLILGFTLLLVVIGIAIMPCWRHSAAWGYWPGACVGLLLVGVGAIAAGGRLGLSDAPAERLAAQPKIEARIEAPIIGPVPRHRPLPGVSGPSGIVSTDEQWPRETDRTRR
ncbi:MAG: DUF3309 domain-containing protein [Rhodospirillales bacterium]|nr:DUF3309 domain-containing protein [Rhodospirillales bacterium]